MSKVIVGLSGGVDSAVTAYLLKKQGYEVSGLTLKLCDDAPVDDAAIVADALGISHQILDLRDRFRSEVVDTFVSEYENGRTPNPCLLCNRAIKWHCMLEYADSNGYDYLGTGHYARIERLADGRYAVRTAKSIKKDQSYVLYRLSQEQLKRTLMPCGEYEKDMIRQIAAEAGLPVASKADSQEICFIPNDDHASYIEKYTGRISKPGNFVDADGNVLGKHKGIIRYTVGQRKGLGIAMGHPVYVTEIRPDSNEVVLGGDDKTGGYTVNVRNVYYQGIEGPLAESIEGIGKIRYNHKGSPCKVHFTDDGNITAEFSDYQRAVTPGQGFVFYKDGIIMMGGSIF